MTIHLNTLLATPNPLWYASRGTGAVSMLLLTVSVLLGIGTTVRWQSAVWPRYFNPTLHRNVSLMVICFLAVHIGAALLDPYARLGLGDALIPFTSRYRPVWLGLGVVSAEVTVALVLSSALQPLIGYRLWRWIHWLAYGAWPIAVLHSLGTGSDVHAGWFLWLTAACVAAVWIALVVWRLSLQSVADRPLKVALAVLATMSIVVLIIWTANGPLQPGWARVSGTPQNLLKPGPP